LPKANAKYKKKNPTLGKPQTKLKKGAKKENKKNREKKTGEKEEKFQKKREEWAGLGAWEKGTSIRLGGWGGGGTV